MWKITFVGLDLENRATNLVHRALFPGFLGTRLRDDTPPPIIFRSTPGDLQRDRKSVKLLSLEKRMWEVLDDFFAPEI